MRDAVRVALLARPGAGTDRLREALHAAGATLVLEADPTTLEPGTLAGAGAESVVVLLDPAVEDALDRLDAVLHDPAIDVLYEEAAVAAAREGWDVARWTRHLAAKLLQHGDVLPPGAGAMPAAEALDVAADAPFSFDPVDAEHDGGFDLPAVDSVPATPTPVAGLQLDSFEPAEREASPPPAVPASAEAAPGDGRGHAIRDFRRDLADIERRIGAMSLVDDGGSPADAGEPTVPDEAAPDDAEPAAPEDGAMVPPAEDDASLEFVQDAAPPEFAPDAAPLEFVQDAAPLDFAPDAAPVEFAQDTPPVAGVADDTSPGLVEEAAAPPAGDAPRPAGAVLVYAGIGGPDAVRQFLGALPPAFPLPVLIHQRLDGGRHDRLVQQMARATTLPVELAAQGQPASPGHVYILPPELGLAGDATGLRFVAGGDPLASLPAAESAVLMFSGSDTALVDAAMQHAHAGAMVAGQSPEDCYDAEASDALVARGAESGPPAELARRLAERWAA